MLTQRRVDDETRSRPFVGLYDGPANSNAPHATRVRLLNPAYDGDDATGRRFSQLEVE